MLIILPVEDYDLKWGQQLAGVPKLSRPQKKG